MFLSIGNILNEKFRLSKCKYIFLKYFVETKSVQKEVFQANESIVMLSFWTLELICFVNGWFFTSTSKAGT
jgi:hypothetical protein